jgi:predicted Fe-Mo cluster-binding NifX family protein
MKIAIPLFGERVSPHFGSSSKLLLVVIRNNKIVQRTTWNLGVQNAMRIAQQLASSGVDQLICGGIQRNHKQWLARNGICVLDNQKGVAEELITEMNKSGVFKQLDRKIAGTNQTDKLKGEANEQPGQLITKHDF